MVLLLFFSKDGFGTKKPTKVDMPLNNKVLVVCGSEILLALNLNSFKYPVRWQKLFGSARQKWQYRLELTKLCYHPWFAGDEGRVLHVLSHVV